MEYELKFETLKHGLFISVHKTNNEAKGKLAEMVARGAVAPDTEAHITRPYRNGKAVRERWGTELRHGRIILTWLPSVVLTDA